MDSNNASSGSKRWTHFYSALQLAIQRSAHKWSFDDFVECFSLWAEESPDGAASVYNTISNYQESQITTDIDNLLKEYHVKENLDILHTVVTDAVARKESGTVGNDVWKEDLPPQAAVRARTVPLLEAEAARIRAMLKDLDDRNDELQRQLKDSDRAKQETDDKTSAILARTHQVYEQCMKMSMEEIEMWAVQSTESRKPVQHS